MLDAEELHDAIALATSRPGQLQVRRRIDGHGDASCAALPASSDVKYFMQTFGQSNRNNPPRPLAGSPLQPLLLMQSPVVNDRVLAKKDSRVERLLATL